MTDRRALPLALTRRSSVRTKSARVVAGSPGRTARANDRDAGGARHDRTFAQALAASAPVSRQHREVRPSSSRHRDRAIRLLLHRRPAPVTRRAPNCYLIYSCTPPLMRSSRSTGRRLCWRSRYRLTPEAAADGSKAGSVFMEMASPSTEPPYCDFPTGCPLPISIRPVYGDASVMMGCGASLLRISPR